MKKLSPPEVTDLIILLATKISQKIERLLEKNGYSKYNYMDIFSQVFKTRVCELSLEKDKNKKG